MSEAMVLLLLYDGTKIEIEDCEDIIHEPGGLICVDYLGSSLATFLNYDVMGYTFDPRVITRLKVDGDQAEITERRRRR